MVDKFRTNSHKDEVKKNLYLSEANKAIQSKKKGIRVTTSTTLNDSRMTHTNESQVSDSQVSDN